VNGIHIRRYRDEDEASVRGLLDRSLVVSPAGGAPSDLFRWKHHDNPFGRSFMLVAEAGGRVVGLRAFLRWEFETGEEVVRAVRAVDTATDPEFQGRGVFSRLTLAALEALRGEVDLVFNTPNERSGPGYLKMGWRPVGRVPVRVRVRRPLRFLRRLRTVRQPATRRRLPAGGGMAPADALTDDLNALVESRAGRGPRLNTRRDLAHLRWRYAAAPVEYRAVRDEAGVALFRIRGRGGLTELAIADLFVRPGDRAGARRLLSRALRSAPSDHATFMAPPGDAGAAAARRLGFITGRGPMLMVNPLRPDIEPAPDAMASWALSVGDLEVL
jgi:GNAT superfamily N-acetyltransferase